MEENNIIRITNEVIDDLKSKIEYITILADSVSEGSKPAANEIRNKAIAILTKAGNKVLEESKNIKDVQEYQNGLKKVSDKAKGLYDEVFARIKLLRGEVDIDGMVEHIENNVVSINNKKTIVDDNDIVDNSDIGKKTIAALADILKRWVKHEESYNIWSSKRI